MASKAKRRTVQVQRDEFVGGLSVRVYDGNGRLLGNRKLNAHEYMAAREGFEDGYRAAQRDAKKNRKE